MDPSTLEVILVGLVVVFLTLEILTLATEIQEKIINKYFMEEEEREEEKIAAIVAAIQSKGEG